MNVKRVISLILVFPLAFCCAPLCGAQDNTVPELAEYGFVDCGDVKIEYGVYGKLDGEPLLLLPPNGGSMHSFDGNILPEMAKHFKVITVSPRGTGNSGWKEGTMNFETMSEDLLKLLDYLGIAQTNIFGFSDGGNLGFVFTLAHQDRVKALAVMGSNINTRGTKTFNQIGIVFEYLYLCAAAKITGDEKIAIKRDIQGMMVGQPRLTYDDLSQIKVPVLNIYGENDMIKRSHSKMITRSIEGAREIMIVGGGHSSCFNYTDEIINPALLEFYGVDTQ